MKWPRDFPLYAFNFNDQIDLQGIVEALNRAGVAGVLLLSANAIEFSRLTYLVKLFEAAKIESEVELYLELDHCNDLIMIEKCMSLGFDMVMADFSEADFETNVALTRSAVEMGKARGVLVEGEIGKIPTLEALSNGGQPCLTDPHLALKFVDQTHVNMLAISVGNLHGSDSLKPVLDFNLISSIVERVSIPLVLHGSDFLSNDVLLRAFRAGISKANIGPELRIAYVNAMQDAVSTLKQHIDHRPILEHCRGSIERLVLKRLSVLTTLRDGNT